MCGNAASMCVALKFQSTCHKPSCLGKQFCKKDYLAHAVRVNQRVAC